MLLAKDEGSSHRKQKEVVADDPLAKTMGEETLLSESNHSKEEEGVATQTVSAFPSSIHGMELTFTSPWCPVTICLRHRAMCGSPFIVVIRRFLGPLWLTPFPILIYAKGHRSLCLFSWNLGLAPPWVGRSGWTKSCLIRVSWWRYSK